MDDSHNGVTTVDLPGDDLDREMGERPVQSSTLCRSTNKLLVYAMQ